MVVRPRRVSLLAASAAAVVIVACSEPHADWRDADAVVATAPLHPTTTQTPVTLDGLPTGHLDPLGRPVVVACGTCHEHRDAAMLTESGELETFHVGMVVQHGALSCGSCHDASRRDMLRLADGTSIEMADTMVLCGQCHGPQLRDYEHGSHGGMTGYWDLTAGPRVRNHCVMCHDPHDPAFPLLAPLPGPRDRGLRVADPTH